MRLADHGNRLNCKTGNLGRVRFVSWSLLAVFAVETYMSSTVNIHICMFPSSRVTTLFSACQVVCAGIHMRDISSFHYRLLWKERWILLGAIHSFQRERNFLSQVPNNGHLDKIHRCPLRNANEFIGDRRTGRFDGAAVLVP